MKRISAPSLSFALLPLSLLLRPRRCRGTAASPVVINEVAHKGSPGACAGQDWIELHNGGRDPVDLANYTLHDDKGPDDEDARTFGPSTVIAAGGYLLLCRDVDFAFGVGGDDTVTLLDGSGEIVSVASLDGGGGDDATLALFPGTGYRYTEAATPGGENVLAEPRPLGEKLAEQNEAGGAFFLDDVGGGGEIAFARVVDVHVQVSNESLAIIREHPTWEDFVPFSEFSVSNPTATGEPDASSQLSAGGGGKIRTKGQSTLMITACLGLANVPFQIEFDAPWNGMEVVYLRNHLGDASYMRDYASHALLKRFGLPYLRCRPVRFYLNGEYVGFYTLMEAPTQGYVMQRSFGVFDPADTALYKVKTTIAECPITDETIIATAQGEAVPDPYYFERGDHRLDPPFGSDIETCLTYFFGELGKESADLYNGILNEYDNSCGEALVGLGRVDRDYGPKSTEAGMVEFVNSVFLNSSRTDIKDAIDADQWIKNFAAYAVTMNHDSILGSVNNLYLATTDGGDSWSIVQYDHNGIASRGGSSLCSEACAFRFIFQPILRPTCGAVEEHIILGRILNDDSSWDKYLNYVEEFARILESTIGDLRLYGRDIKSFIVSDPFANGMTDASYEESELGLGYSDFNSESTPLLKTLSARLEQVNAQLTAIESETMPRGGIYDNDEKCPDWRDSDGDSYIAGSAFDDSCGIPLCEDAAPCFDETPFTCVDGNLIVEECKPAGSFCGPCYPYSTCGSGVKDESSKFVTGDSCGEQLGDCELGAGCFDHKSGICAYDGSILAEECRSADVYCRECYPHSRCGSLKASVKPEVDDDPITDPSDDSEGPDDDATCPFCPGGLTVDADTSLPAGPDGVSYTCGQISQFASFFKPEGDECSDILLAEPLCCPSDRLCPFCKGLAVDSEMPIPETEFTCGDLSGFAMFADASTEDCTNMMLAETLCCQTKEKEEPAGPCGFCSAGLTADADTSLPTASDGKSYTCGELTELVDSFDSGSDTCNEILLAEPYCCPTSDPCGFCAAGLTADADTSLPAGSDGISYTCGQLTAFVYVVGSGTKECNDMLLAEPLCCPPSNSETSVADEDESADTTTDSGGPCGFCSEGLTVDAETSLPVAPDGVTYTCGQLFGVVNFVKSGSDECDDMLRAEPICCPPSNSEEDTSVPINPTEETGEQADEPGRMESDQDPDQSGSSDASEDEEAIDTNENSEASSLSTASLALILCTSIAYIFT